jgi:hypothetical protein
LKATLKQAFFNLAIRAQARSIANQLRTEDGVAKASVMSRQYRVDY